ncbi:sensor histidine kinase [Tunturiibacter gelidiferens]|uniref:sensor histidine kinase n=1 Tax=Tunturiibacter gelidiferens TaxID=3069689 RepID=UPI003D9B9EEA
MRQAVECRFTLLAKMLCMNRENVLNLRSFWQIQIIGWCCFYLFHLLESIHAFLTKRVFFREETVPVFFMFLGSFVLRPFCRWLLRQSRSWIAFELKAAAAAMVTSIPVACAAGLILQNFNHVPWHALVTVWAWSFFMLFMWCSLYFSIKQWQQSSMEKERLLRAESELREARLLALRYQLNPHFLFNSLNAVSTLVLDGNAPAATRMLAQIGDLLRTSLDSEVTAEVTLSQELAFTEGYLAIEQTRLGERLKIDMAVPLETRDALVPNMLLQPLVENAVRYGVAPLIEGGWIAIKSALDADRLRIVIGNSGRRGEGEQKKNGNGIGLGNTAERLKTLYGANFEFSLGWPEAGGCEVVLELPLRRTRNLLEASPCAL